MADSPTAEVRRQNVTSESSSSPNTVDQFLGEDVWLKQNLQPAKLDPSFSSNTHHFFKKKTAKKSLPRNLPRYMRNQFIIALQLPGLCQIFNIIMGKGQALTGPRLNTWAEMGFKWYDVHVKWLGGNLCKFVEWLVQVKWWNGMISANPRSWSISYDANPRSWLWKLGSSWCSLGFWVGRTSWFYISPFIYLGFIYFHGEKLSKFWFSQPDIFQPTYWVPKSPWRPCWYG